jgi:hypothetical protein
VARAGSEGKQRSFFFGVLCVGLAAATHEMGCDFTLVDIGMTQPVPDAPVELIWNKGIAARCDRRVPDEFPNGRTYSAVPTFAGAYASSKLPDNLISDPSAFDDLRENELVWVRLSWLKSFVRQVLPRVGAKFTLVTGDSDSCVPSELLAEARAILGCRGITRWYTQNYDGSMPSERVSPIPIGIDFHMLSERPIWGEQISTPAQQEQTLLSIRDGLPSLENRVPKVYVDFGWQMGFGLRNYRRFHPLRGTSFHENRRRVVKIMRAKEAVVCQGEPLPRSHMWRERGKYRFVLSPPGTGLDCHRTWEALALGHLVLVPSSALDPLYTGLPVIPFKHWDEITPENLRKWFRHYVEYAPPLDAGRKLLTSFWVDQMRSTKEPTVCGGRQ